MSAPTPQPKPIPVRLIIRALKLPRAMDAEVQWSPEGLLVACLPNGETITFRQVTSDEVDAFYGVGRMGEFKSAWAISDGRFCMEKADHWVFHVADPGVMDRLARALADRALEKMAEQAQAA